jgi:hypothetical protein
MLRLGLLYASRLVSALAFRASNSCCVIVPRRAAPWPWRSRRRSRPAVIFLLPQALVVFAKQLRRDPDVSFEIAAHEVGIGPEGGGTHAYVR